MRRNTAMSSCAAALTICPRRSCFTAEDSGTKDKPVVSKTYKDEKPVISGGIRLENLNWKPFTNGILRAQDARRICRRRKSSSTASGRFWRAIQFRSEGEILRQFRSGRRFQRNARRAGRIRWAATTTRCTRRSGAFHWRITGKNMNGEPTLEGGWQNNRGAAAHRTCGSWRTSLRTGRARRMVSQPARIRSTSIRLPDSI